MKKLHVVWAGIFLAIVFSLQAQTAISIRPVIHAPVASSSNDLNTMLEAVEATTPTAAESVPVAGTFQSAQNPSWPPLPGNIHNTPAWDLGDGVWLLDDLDVDYSGATSLLSGGGMHAMDVSGPPSFDDVSTNGGTNTYGFSPLVMFPTNGLWLQITNVSNGLASLNLMNATDSVYEIISTVALVNGSNHWNIETEVWPTNPAVMPFSVPESGRTNLFIWAMDWTGVTNNGNTIPDWWFWEYFGTVNLSDTNLDSAGGTLLYDYQTTNDPNIIQFSLQFTNYTVNSNPAYGTIGILDGVPSYMAVLINDTNHADAVWQPYSSNVVAFLSSGNGLYTVSVGLRGLPADATQTWVSRQLTLDNIAPLLLITNPVTSTVSVPMIQLQGLVGVSLSKLTYDVSNALGVVTNQTGYCNPTFFDTNALGFTTNAFQCYDIGLTNGLNTITLHATDVAGNTTTTNVSYTLSYAGVTNSPTLALIWPTNGTVISGSNFTMQAQVNDATATLTATINSTNFQGLIERNGAVWFDNLPLAAGTNILTLTATSAAGNMTTTNITLIQSGVLVTLDPLADDQFNQTNVYVTGTVSDPSYDIYVNGQEAYPLDDEGDWEADGVPVSATGAATFDVEIYVGDPVNAGSQKFSQPQPAVVSLMSYTRHNHVNDTLYNYCLDGAKPYQSDEVVNWLFQSGGMASSEGSGIGGDCTPVSSSGTINYAGGLNGYSPAWESKDVTESLDAFLPGEGGGERGVTQAGSATTDTQTRVMILPASQQAIGQSALYLVMAQVTNEDSGLQLAAGAVQFMHQLAGTTTEDVTNADGSVWTEAVVSGAAGAPIEATPIAAGDISFTGMKISPSRIVYFSVDPDGVPASYFNASAVQNLLQSELSSNVFDSPPTGKFVKVKVGVDPTWNGQLGWSNPKFSQVNRVTWHLTTSDVSYRDDGHDIQINEIKVDNLASTYGTSPTAQTYVNIFVHEGIWGNAGGNHDCLSGCTDGEISAGFLGTSAYLFAPYFVFPSSRTTLRNEFGF